MKLDINELADWLKYSYNDTINIWELFEEYARENNVEINNTEVIASQFASKVIDIL